MEIFLNRSKHLIGSIMFFELLKEKATGSSENKYGSVRTAKLANVLKVCFQSIQEGKKKPKS